MENARFGWMLGLNGKFKVWIDNARFEWIMQGLNGKSKVWMEMQGWIKIQSLNGKSKVWMENTMFEWKIQGLNE